MLSTKSTFFQCFGWVKISLKREAPSNSTISLISQPLKTGLKHDAVDKNNVFSMFSMGQNQPETRSSRQIQQFYKFLQPLKTGLKHDAVVKTCVF